MTELKKLKACLEYCYECKFRSFSTAVTEKQHQLHGETAPPPRTSCAT